MFFGPDEIFVNSLFVKFCHFVFSSFNSKSIPKSHPPKPQYSKCLTKSTLRPQGKHHDICIIQLEEFVTQEILTELEETHSVYFPPRDDTLGKARLSCLEYAIENSSVVLLLVTNEFAKQPMRLGYFAEQIINVRGHNSVIVAVEKAVDIAMLPLNVRWLLELCHGFVYFSQTEPFPVRAIRHEVNTMLHGDRYLCDSRVDDTQNALLVVPVPGPAPVKYDICLIHDRDDDTTCVDAHIAKLERQGLRVFSSVRDALPGTILSNHLLCQMHSAAATVFVVNSAGPRPENRTEFLIAAALTRTDVPCIVFQDRNVTLNVGSQNLSAAHRIVPLASHGVRKLDKLLVSLGLT